MKSRFSSQQLTRKFRQCEFAVHLQYGRDIELRLMTPDDLAANWKRRLSGLLDRPIDDVPQLLSAIQTLERAGESVVVYPDAEEWIQQRLHDRNIAGLVEEIRKNPAKHALRTELLKEPLLPYQLEGVAFAVGAGARCWQTTWGWEKPSRGSVWRNCFRASRVSSAC